MFVASCVGSLFFLKMWLLLGYNVLFFFWGGSGFICLRAL